MDFHQTITFAFNSAFTFQLDTFPQSPFSGIKDQFALGSPNMVSDSPGRRKESSVGSDYCPDRGPSNFPNREKPEGAKNFQVNKVVQWFP
jgi:hypothetical protein